MTKLIIVFRSFVNARKNSKPLCGQNLESLHAKIERVTCKCHELKIHRVITLLYTAEKEEPCFA
jgi:hypothetical protein